MTNIRRFLIPLAVVAGGAACSAELAPFEDLADLRILAIQVEDPWLLPDQETTLRSLVYAEPDATVSYAWDWCPFSTGPSQEYACALTQEDLDDIASQVPGADSPQLKLGSAADVTFKYPLPAPALQGICAALLSEDVPEGLAFIDCKESFPVTLRLIATTDRGHRVVAVRTMKLLYDEPEPVSDLNVNPAFTGVRILTNGEPLDSAVPLVDGFVVEREQDYTLFVDVTEDQSQTYTTDSGEQRENLFVHWFYEAGEFDEESTGFIDGFLTVEDLAENRFSAPDASFTRDELALYFVMRDERGGIDFITRTVSLD